MSIFKENNGKVMINLIIELGGEQYNILDFIKMSISDALEKIKELQILNYKEYTDNCYGSSTINIYDHNKRILNDLEYYVNLQKNYQEAIADKTFSYNSFLEFFNTIPFKTTKHILQYFTYNKILDDYNRSLYSKTTKWNIEDFLRDQKLWFEDVEYSYNEIFDTFTPISKPKENIPGVVFCNRLEAYINSLGFSLGVFGYYIDERNNTNYESQLNKGFNDKVFSSKEHKTRTMAIVDAYLNTKLLNFRTKNQEYEEKKWKIKFKGL